MNKNKINSKPDHGSLIGEVNGQTVTPTRQMQTFMDDIQQKFNDTDFTVATLPTASENKGRQIYVDDETGGATLAFSDGTNWRRVQDRVVVS